MKKLSCPSCGAEVSFISVVSVFATCSYCSASLLRTDIELKHLGEMAKLPEDSSPIQLGTTGRIGSAGFTCIGRIRRSWSKGYWDEWYLYFDGQREGWLAVAQGFYMITEELKETGNLPNKNELKVGNSYQLANTAFRVDDIKDVVCSFSQGELPFSATLNSTYTIVDLSAPGGQFASLEYSDGQEDSSNTQRVSAYIGKYVEYNSLNLQGVKQFDGW